MTLEKSIKLIHPETSKDEIAELEYYSGFNEDAILIKIDQAIIDICNAAEKQVGALVFETHYMQYGHTIYTCPDCNAMLTKNVNYCSDCGKKIVWKRN